MPNSSRGPDGTALPDGGQPEQSDASPGDDAADGSGADGAGAADGQAGDTSPWRRRLAVGGGAIVLLVGLLGIAYFLGIIGAPDAGLEDRGDWESVNDERTVVVTTLWVSNPNPVGVSLGDGVTARYDVRFNGVRLATGNKTGVDIPTGNSTLTLRTTLLNERLPAWWVAFVRANETLYMDINGTIQVNVGPTASHPIRENTTALEDSTPIITALSNAASETEGTHTKSVSADAVTNDTVLDATVSEDTEQVTVGYEIREGSANWGAVTETETEVQFTLRVHNPGDVPVPALPDGLGVVIDVNDVRLFEGDSGSLSASSVDRDAVIAPGETRTVRFTVTMANDRVDEWFTSHVARGERTDVSATFQLVFAVPETDTEIRVPSDSPATYDCDLQTAILEDNQTTETDCGETPG